MYINEIAILMSSIAEEQFHKLHILIDDHIHTGAILTVVDRILTVVDRILTVVDQILTVVDRILKVVDRILSVGD